MTINEYQKEALRTESDVVDILFLRGDEPLRVLQGVMGLCGESGECIDIVKKYIFQSHPFDKEHLAKELGDVAWYLAVCADAIGYDLESILQMNVDKLRARYPDKFDPELSQHRKDGDI